MPSLLLASCGTYVPQFQEFWDTEGDTGQKVANIAAQVSCELRQAFASLASERSTALKYNLPTKLKWLEGWGAQVNLTLTVVESSAIAPGATLTQPFAPLASPTVFTLGLGGSHSNKATRTGIVKMFFPVRDLLKKVGPQRSCIPSRPAPGFLFVESDLKLKDWLYAAVAPEQIGITTFPNSNTGPLNQNVISHQVTFQIVTTGSVTPSWKLVRVSVNPASPFLTATRDRTQDLTITMGPIAKVDGVEMLAPPALATSTAREIGLAIQTIGLNDRGLP